MIVVLAEKPSVARELADVLGATARRPGYFEGRGYRVTWAIGHLVGLAQPDAIDPAWKAWSRATLPMLPERFPLRVMAGSAAQYRVVAGLLRDRATTGIIAATDAGREGELIFRFIYERAGCKKPWQRLWLSSMTHEAIRNAFANLAPGTRYDRLAEAARARSQADWVVGLNLSRAYTLTNGALYSVGRVQTPTLALIVARDEEIRNFVPEPYLEVEAIFASSRGEYRGVYYVPPREGMRDERGRLRPFRASQARLPADGALAAAIVARARNGSARVAVIDRTTRRIPPPQLFDLTELQREANRLYGYSAQKTLDAAQALYERHKALSYPRTDSRHLPQSVAATLPDVLKVIEPRYGELVAPSNGRPLGRRWVDDGKVADHHALIPTDRSPPALPPGSAEARIYDLVCRRLLMAWHADRVEAVTRLLTEVRASDGKGADLFATQGIAIENAGWSVLEVRSQRPAREALPPKIPPGLAEGDTPRVVRVNELRKQTQPPKPHTDASLLSAMESAGRRIEDDALRDAMRECGLGTPATRAATIEVLLTRGYLKREGKTLASTPLGEALVRAVHPLVKSAEMTGRWERRLRAMERGEERLERFMGDIGEYVREVVAVEAAKPMAAREPRRKFGRPARPRGRARYRSKTAKVATTSRSRRGPRRVRKGAS